MTEILGNYEQAKNLVQKKSEAIKKGMKLKRFKKGIDLNDLINYGYSETINMA
jgi:hypothetical protein